VSGHVFGIERLSKEFVGDLKVLLDTEPQVASDLAVMYATDRSFDEEDLAQAVADLNLGPERGERLARIVLFFARSLRRDELTTALPEEISRELSALGFEEATHAKFVTFRDSLLEYSERATLEAARAHWMRVGCPRIESVAATCDLRCIYELAERGEEYDIDESVSEPRPGKLLATEPVVLLEFETTLNGVKENHVFQVTERELRQLIRALRRAQRRCSEAKNALRQLTETRLPDDREER
jgi:hypothetical protein